MTADSWPHLWIIVVCIAALLFGGFVAVQSIWRLHYHRWSPIQRAKIRLGVGEVIFLVALGVLWTYLLLIIASRSDPIGPRGESQIVQMLKERLPDSGLMSERHRELISAIGKLTPNSDLLGQRHQEMVAAIKGVGGIEVQPQSARLKVSFLGGVLVFLFLGSVVWMIIAPRWRISIPRVLAAGSFTLLSVGSLLGVEKVSIFELSWGKGAGSTQATAAETRISIDLTPKGLELDCDPERYLLTDFPVGKHEGSDKVSLRARAIGESLRKENEGGRLAAVILVGSADKQQLQPSARRVYDSNAGLAQARAKWVQARLEEGYRGTIAPLLVLSTGPSFVGLSVKKENLAGDRSVLTCAVWTSKRVAEPITR